MNALALPEPTHLPVTLEAWRDTWRQIGHFEARRKWFYGDLFNAGLPFTALPPDQFHSREQITAAVIRLMPHIGIEGKVLAHLAHVADKFPAKSRVPKLTWDHHREVVHLSHAKAVHWLRRAAAKEWTVVELRRAMAEEEGERERGPALFTGFIPGRAALEAVRWFQHEFEETPLEDWPQERRRALKREFQPLLDILKVL